MILPTKPLPTGSVTIEGTTVPIRALSYTEVMTLGRLPDDDEQAERFMIACSVGIEQDEAAAWVQSTDGPTVERLLSAISVLSGLRKDPSRGSTGGGPAERRSSEP